MSSNGRTMPLSVDIKQEYCTSGLTDDDVLRKLSPSFYSQESNVIQDVMMAIPETPDAADTRGQLHLMEKQLEIVSTRLAGRIMGSYSEFAIVQAVDHVSQFASDLSFMALLCREGRSRLAEIDSRVYNAAYSVVSKEKRRVILKSIHKTLKDVSNLKTLKNSIATEITTVQLITEFKSSSSNYSKLSAVIELQHSVDILERSIFGKLESEITKTMVALDMESFWYETLGAWTTVLELFRTKIFVSVIEDRTRLALQRVLFTKDRDKERDMIFRDVLKKLEASPSETRMKCLLTAFRDMQEYLKNIISLANRDNKSLTAVCEGLRSAVYDELQRVISLVMASANTPDFRLDQFMLYIEASRAFAHLGEAFAVQHTSSLRNVIKMQCRGFVKVMHQTKMEHFKTMLDNENWLPIPIDEEYLSVMLIEGDSDLNQDTIVSLPSPPATDLASLESLFALDPFTPIPKDKKNKSQPQANDTHISGLGKQQYVASSCTSFIVRTVGTYIKMLAVLNDAAQDITNGLQDMLEYYAATVDMYFGRPPGIRSVMYIAPHSPHSSPSSALRTALIRWRRVWPTVTAKSDGEDDNTQGNVNIDDSDSPSAALSAVFSAPRPVLSGAVSTTSPPLLYGLAARAVAFESLLLVHEVLQRLKPHIQDVSGASNLYSGLVDMFPDLRMHMYRNVTYVCLTGMEQIPNEIAALKWDVKEFGSDECHAYIKTCIQIVRQLSGRLLSLSGDIKYCPGCVPAIWECVCIIMMEQLVEGFSRVRKCTNEGRAMMSLDLQTLTTELETHVKVKPVPRSAYADSYIKAFYLSETGLVQWVKEQKDYPARQIGSIVQCGVASNMKKKDREVYTGKIEKLIGANLGITST